MGRGAAGQRRPPSPPTSVLNLNPRNPWPPIPPSHRLPHKGPARAPRRYCRNAVVNRFKFIACAPSDDLPLFRFPSPGSVSLDLWEGGPFPKGFSTTIGPSKEEPNDGPQALLTTNPTIANVVAAHTQGGVPLHDCVYQQRWATLPEFHVSCSDPTRPWSTGAFEARTSNLASHSPVGDAVDATHHMSRPRNPPEYSRFRHGARGW